MSLLAGAARDGATATDDGSQYSGTAQLAYKRSFFPRSKARDAHGQIGAYGCGVARFRRHRFRRNPVRL